MTRRGPETTAHLPSSGALSSTRAPNSSIPKAITAVTRPHPAPRRYLSYWAALILACACAGPAITGNAQTGSVGPEMDVSAAAQAPVVPRIRLAYIIPSNRMPQPDGAEHLASALLLVRDWFRDQMKLYGMGTKTFEYETEEDGVTPLVHIVQVTETDSFLRGDIYGRTLVAASNAGVSIWAIGEVWLLVPEIHIQNPDASITGGVTLGASFGSGHDPGVAIVGSDALARFRPDYLSDDRPYDGLIIPEIGPFPLRQDISFPWFEDQTISSVSSSVLGAMTHELIHAFGQPHDYRNDENFLGLVMGHGLRGFRGCVFPGRYPTNYTRLGLGAARALAVSRYFGASAVEDVLPALNVTTSSAMPENGHIRIGFTASDDSGLAVAQLHLDGNMIADLALVGTSLHGEFTVHQFTQNAANSFDVAVWDMYGNRRNAHQTIQVGGGNRSPTPKIKMIPPHGLPGTVVTLDATGSTDPANPAEPLVFEWDVRGDGNFRSTPSHNIFEVTLNEPGIQWVQLAVTDQAGARSISEPIPLHTHLPKQKIEAVEDGAALRMSWPSRMGFLYDLEHSPNLATWAGFLATPIQGNGQLQQVTTGPTPAASAFYRLAIWKRTQP